MHFELNRESQGIRFSLIACVFALMCGLLTASPSLGHPTGFVETDVPPGTGDDWNEAVGITFQENGRGWAWERGGRVWITGETTPFLDISEEVGAWHDHGMLGFALHPSFVQNGYVYLFYLVDRHHLLNCQEDITGDGIPDCGPGYDPTIDETFNAAMGRLTRYQAVLPAGDSDYSQATTADLSSRTVLIGDTISTGIASTSRSHVTGSLVFGTDTTLLISTGDGASSVRDAGSAITVPDSNNYTLQALADGILDPNQDVGAHRAQMLDSLHGKILRIDPLSGEGVSSNPYFEAGDPNSIRSKVWALGFRNPYRMSLMPDTGTHDPADANPGTLIVGDVGRADWEELNFVESPAQNFGWPLYEGMEFLDINAFVRGEVDNPSAPNPQFGINGCSEAFFQFDDLIVQDTLNTPSFPNPCDAGIQIDPSTPTHVHTRPVLTWAHDTDEVRSKSYDGSGDAVFFRISDAASPIQGTEFSGSSVTGGLVYTGTQFPAEFQGSYYFADFTGLWMRRLVFDAAGNPVSVEEFSGPEVGGVVSIASNPVSDGLHYISWTTDITRLDYAPGGNFAPEAVITADTLFGSSPLTVQFDGTNSTDPELQTLTYAWDFGDGATSTQAMPQHTFNSGSAPASFTVTLTVDDGQATDSVTSIVSTNNSPPTAEIISPVDGTSYLINQDTTYDLTANISDAEQTLSQLSCEWQIALHHNTHNHQNPPIAGCQQQAVLSDEGCDGDTYFYRVRLTVTDPFGMVATDSVDLPQGDCAGGPFIPVANGDLASVNVGASITIPVLANDIDDTGLSPSSVQIETAPVGGSISSIDAATGDITLLHDGVAGGPLTFTYSVADTTNARSNAATVLVNVTTDQNGAPQLAAIADVSVPSGEVRTIGISATDPDGDGLSLSSLNLPGFASLTDFGDGTGEITFTPALSDIGQYTITVDALDDASVPLGDSTDFIVTVTAMGGSARVGDGLVVFYPLTEGAGTTAADASNNGTPMNLDLNGSVTWLGSGPGLSFNGGRLGTSTAASKVINALQSTGSSSFEVFAMPANTTQDGPARLVSVGADNANQNFVMGQDEGDYQVRLQHTSKDAKSRPRLQVGNGVSVAVQHLVHTFDGGVERFFIDGVEQPDTVVLSGDYGSWDGTDLFNVGNEASNQRPFVGEIYLVAVYDRALTATEVQQNFAAGLGGTLPVNQPPVANAGSDQTLVLPNTLMLSGSVSDDGLPNPPGATTVSWSQQSGPGTASFSDDTSLTSTVSFDVDGSYTLRLTANDGEWIDVDDVVITVDPIMPLTVPDVTGLSQAAAESLIVSDGFTVGAISTANSDTVPAGDVIDQSPLAGTTALPGSAINVTVSLGPTPILVPDVTGLAQAAAESAIVADGFIVGTVTTVSSDTVPIGNVVNQSPVGGSSAPQGSAVNVTISSGPNLPPDVMDDSYNVTTNASLTILAPGVLGNDSDPNGDPLSAVLVSGTTSGVLSLGTDGSFSYTPNADFNGADSFVYRASDGTFESGDAVVTFTVQDAPSNIAVPSLVGENFASPVSGGDTSWITPVGFGDEVALYVEQVTATPSPVVDLTTSHAGQVIVDPNNPAWFVRNGDGPYFMAGIGDPEDFLYRGVRNPDGTRNGDQQAIIDGLVTTGANGIYVMAVRSNGGDGDATHNPFIDSDPTMGLDNNILHQWETWFAQLDAAGVTVTLFIYDDSASIWDTGDVVGPEEQAFVEGLVNRFKHHDNLIWVIAEEYSESFTPARISNLAAVVRAADEFSHPIAVHKLQGLTFEEFADDPNIDQFGIQNNTTLPPLDQHNDIVTAFQSAAGRYNLNMMENNQQTSGDSVRLENWATAMGGSYLMVFGWDVVTTAVSDLNQLGTLKRFMEAGAIHEMAPDDLLAFGGTEFVLTNAVGKHFAYKSTPGIDSLGIQSMLPGTYRFRWVDPVSGIESLSNAETTILASGLRVGQIIGQFSTSIPAGDVIDQSPTAGALVQSNARIQLTVSLGPPPVPVPDVVGLAQVLAESNIVAGGLSVGVVTAASSATVPIGDVIDQSPAAGELVPPGSTVDLTVSSGPIPVIVPDVVGAIQAVAESDIVAAGLIVGTVSTATSPTVPAGSIISQNPSGGSSVPPGSAVDITVSTGPLLLTVPDVTGLSQSAAEASILSDGFAVGAISSASSTTVPLGDVISQNPLGGVVIAEGSPIDLVVSSGPAPANNPPQLNPISDVTVEESGTQTIGISATDPDGDGLSLSSLNLPGFASLTDFGDGTGEITFTPALSDIGQYTITVDALDDASVPLGDSTDFIVTVTAMGGSARVGDGLVVFYPLTEGAGTTAADESNNGTPMNLQLSGAVSWLGSGSGLSFNGGRLGTTGAASKVINALQSSDASSFEVFVLPANTTQDGPARLVSVGGDNANQNFMMGQDEGDYQVRLLHSSKDNKARPRLQVGNGVSVALQHVVHSFDGNVERFYIDGVEQPATVALSGDYDGWDSTDLFNVGNEASSQRPFVGEIYLVAVYDRALTPAEVQQNFTAGLGGTLPVNQPPVANAGMDQTVVLPNTLMLAGSVMDDGLPNPPATTTVSWSQISGSGTASFTDDTSLTSIVSFDAEGSYTLRLTATDGEWIGIDDVVVTVDPIMPLTVPDVTGLSQAAAEGMIVSDGFVVGAITTINSDTIPAGDVIDQSPVGGTTALPGSAINLTVSLGPVPVPVPDVTGLAQAAAETTIINDGFVVGTVTTASSPTAPVGEVIDQNPLGGALATPGSAIDLTVSSGPAPVTVPDVTNQSQAVAETNIVSAGLTVGTVSTANSATVPAGDVIDQNPLGGTLAAPGSAVDLTVSLGPATIPVPDVTGLAQAAAESLIISDGFIVGAITTTNSPTVPVGDVIDQNPLGGTTALPGTAINLTVSLGPAPILVPDVTGLAQATAESLIVGDGFVVGTIVTASSDTVPEGDVISQNPLGGLLAAPGSAIDLLVSDGPNTAPVLDPIGNQSVAEGNSLTLPLSASDDDGHALSFAHDGLPAFMSLTDNGNGTATLTITPGFDDSGIYSITIRVTDNSILPLSDEETFDVTVDNVNRPPQINTINNVSVSEGESLTVPVSASDPDGDGVIFSSPDLPAFAVLNNLAGNTAEIVITPASGDSGIVTVTVDATDDASEPLVSSTAFDIDVQEPDTRVATGLIAYYPFTEGSGTVVSDQSASGSPMNLELSGNVTWLAGSNGASFSGGLVGTTTAASKVIDALVSSGASSFEVWALPANATQDGPARLITVGADNANQNFVLGQDEADYQVRLLHTSKDNKARPRLQAANGVAVAVQHLVHTFDGNVERIYIDGVQHPATVALSGDYSNWDPTDRFNIGNEASSQRPFVGEIYLVAVYDRALSLAEVQTNFAAGPNGDSTGVGPVTAFSDITVEAGVVSPPEFGGHGAQFADVNDNGLPDIYVTRNFQPTDMPELFFENQGAGQFIEGAADPSRQIDNFDTGSHGGVWADFDNDGDFDLFNGSYDQNRLYENNGTGGFTDVTTSAGLPIQSLATRGVIAFDMDRDNDLDIFAVTDFQGSNDPPGQLNEVYRNDGSFTFTAVSAGDLESAPAGQGTVAVDYDNDGDVDVIAGNRTGPMNVLANDGFGDFTLIDPTSIGLTISAGDGITAADVNNDGLVDLMLDQHLFIGTGGGQFAFSRSFETTENHFMGGFADLDNDGDFDLVFPGRNYVYLNDGSGAFSASNVFVVGTIDDPRSVSFADIERDGDLDMYVAQKRASDLLIRNDTTSIGNWLRVSLTRTSGQIGAFGAKVTIYEAGGLGDSSRRIVWREATSATGYLAQDEPELHFGLGEETQVDVRVVYPGGAIVDVTSIPANVSISISE